MYMYADFTDRSRKVMHLAEGEARRVNHGYVDPAHVLLGLLKEGTSSAAVVLKAVGVSLKEARTALTVFLPVRAEQTVIGPLPNDPTLPLMCEAARGIAKKWGHRYVGPEHLLAAIASRDGTVASRMLTIMKVSPRLLIQETRELLGLTSEPRCTACGHGKMAHSYVGCFADGCDCHYFTTSDVGIPSLSSERPPMIDLVKFYARLDAQDPRLNELPAGHAPLPILRRRLEAVELLLSVLDDGPTNVLRVKARHVLAAIQQRLKAAADPGDERTSPHPEAAADRAGPGTAAASEYGREF